MIPSKTLHLLNSQIRYEGESAQIYLSMHAWAAEYGLEGTAKWFLEQYHEEVAHMIKIIQYLNTRGERAKISQLDVPPQDFKSCMYVFEETLKHEMFITDKLKNICVAAKEDGDLQTVSFLDWYLLEQCEEEDNVRRILDKLKIAKDDPAAKLIVDKFVGCMRNK